MNILKIIAVIAVIVAVAFAAIYVLGMFPETKPIAEAATGLAGQAQEYVTNNIPTVIAAGGTIATFGGIALSKVQSATKKVSDIKSQATSEAEKLNQQKNEITEAAKTQVTEATSKATEVQQQFDSYKAEVEPLKTQVTSLQDQVQTAKDENAQFVMSLMSAANGALVTNPVDGKVYSVLKTPPEIHVK